MELSPKLKEDIEFYIQRTEKATSAELRVIFDSKSCKDPLDKAAQLFAEYKMHKTELRNGVLIYLNTSLHQIAIIGDAGIQRFCDASFWESIKDEMIVHFKEGNYSEGFDKGIRKIADKLHQHFPYQLNDSNELSDEVISL
jgi:uncharacterized membrane protein